SPKVLASVTGLIAGLPPSVVEALPSMDDKVLCALVARHPMYLAEEFVQDGMSSGFLGRASLEGALADDALAKYIILYQQRWIERLRRTSSPTALRIRD